LCSNGPRVIQVLSVLDSDEIGNRLWRKKTRPLTCEHSVAQHILWAVDLLAVF